MSCNEFESVVVERELQVPAPLDVVWDELPFVLGDDVDLVAEAGRPLRVRDGDDDRIGVVVDARPGERLAFRWMTVDGDEPPSEVEITLAPSAVGTFVHIRETRLDGARLERSAFRACALARG